jgi:hypothetical protein
MAKAKSPAVEPTRGEYNNNPGNIDYVARNDWVGQLGIEQPRNPQTKPRFARFDSPITGGRAIAQLLQTYQAQGHRTVRAIIGKWAPPNENKTGLYAATVARAVGVGVDDEIDVKRYEVMRPLVEAIIRHENGRVIYSPEQIDEMLRRAGIVKPGAPEVPPKPKKPALKTAAATAAATVGAPGAGVAYIVQNPALQKAVEDTGIPWLVIGFGVIGFAAAVYGVWYAYRAARPKPEGA